jgi:hypothetical protein
MTYSPLLVPVVALVAWTLLVMLWMAATRLPAMKKAGIDVGTLVGGRGANLEGVVADKVQWVSHNYSHLLEQPTLFYAIAITLALMGMDQPINVWLAWGYVGLRILHSLVQGTVNIVLYRFTVFALSTLCLIGLTTHAGLRILHDCGLIG